MKLFLPTSEFRLRLLSFMHFLMSHRSLRNRLWQSLTAFCTYQIWNTHNLNRNPFWTDTVASPIRSPLSPRIRNHFRINQSLRNAHSSSPTHQSFRFHESPLQDGHSPLQSVLLPLLVLALEPSLLRPLESSLLH